MENNDKNSNLIAELGQFLINKKAWWLLPVIILMVLIGVLIIFGSSSAAVSPFIYPLF